MAKRKKKLNNVLPKIQELRTFENQLIYILKKYVEKRG